MQELLLKSYLTDAEREGWSPDEICLLESEAAEAAGDAEASWAWLARADVPSYALKTLKTWRGAEFIKQMGFRTAEAEAVYGKDWLERD
jgi:hypothetical protein